jgi:hypothetical protein
MVQRTKRTVGLATTVLVTGGLGMAAWGLAAGTAEAVPGPMLMYHWCPGEHWDPTWGWNWDWTVCHDDHHRDIDDGNHDRDWWGGPPPPAAWAPPPPWAPAAAVVWNPDAGAWGIWIGGIWIQL